MESSGKMSVSQEDVTKEKVVKAVKEAHKINKESSKVGTYTEEKIYNLGFMPLNEVTGLVVDELEEVYDLDRVKKLWLPKSQKANELINSDFQMLDAEKMKETVKDIDPQYSKKILGIEDRLKQYPFWHANKYSIKMVKIDELICLQSFVNLDRANNHKKKISEPKIEELLDYCFDFDREPPKIHNHFITNNAILFSTSDHDVRPGKIEVRKIEKFAENTTEEKTQALVIPIVEGDPVVYCVRTYLFQPMQDGTTKQIYFLTLQNGIHRAYALKSMGIDYMPCIIIDPATAAETQMISAKLSPERAMQNVSQRPPLMKDFFNPDLTEKFKVRKRLKCLRVEWKIEPFTT